MMASPVPKKASLAQKRRTFRVLIFEDKKSNRWAAQCLECDIAMQANSFQDLMYEISRVIQGHIIVSQELGIDPFEHVRRAPPSFFQLFDVAKVKIQREIMPFAPDTARASGFAMFEGRMAELQPSF